MDGWTTPQGEPVPARTTVEAEHGPAAGPIPLSAEQWQIWLHGALAPDPALYNEQVVIARRGELDLAALGQALNEIIRRHDSLRTVFVASGAEVEAKIHPRLRIDVPFIDLSAEARPGDEAARIAAREAARPFNLSAGPLHRAVALKLGANDHLLVLTMHHLIVDALSVNRVLLPELAALYRGFAEGRPASLPALPLQYGDYARWRREQAAGKAVAARTRAWGRRLAGAEQTVALPADRSRPAALSHRGAVEEIAFSPALTGTLRAFSAAEGVTLYMTLLAGFSAVLHRYTGQEDILVGGVASTRRREGLDRLIGCLINLVALRTRPGAGIPFRDHLGHIRETVLSSFIAGDVPFDQVVREVQPRREPSIHPLVQVLLSLETAEPAIDGWRATYLDGNSGTSKFDLSISLHEQPDRLTGRLVYSTDLFDAATMRRLIAHWTVLLEAAAADPACTLGRLPLMGAAETRQLLVAWNDTARDCPGESLYGLFAAQAAWRPDAAAVTFKDRSWSYRELETAAARIATGLRAAGIGKGDLVAICTKRSFEMVAGLLGILRAGAAYLPLDPAFPAARLALMLDDAKPAAVLTQACLRSSLPATEARIMLSEECTACDGAPPAVPAGDELAYVLYTSGSTGTPNGVAVPQTAVVNLLASMQREPGFGPGDTLLAVTTLSFDIAALELFLPLVSGGRVVIAGREDAADPERLATLIKAAGCTMLQATPATWRGLVETGWQGSPALKLLCGGEALPRELAQMLMRGGAALWNVYGPTETTIWSTLHRVEPGDGPVPIGRPIANTSLYILDPHGNPAPAGVPGDLYIGGAGVARGYLNRSELTARRFVADPFAAGPAARMYCTGDVARWLADGTVEYLGRGDRQIKLRGFRIEPGDIETALETHPAIRQSVVIGRDDNLVAYLVAAEGAMLPGAAELREHLAGRLPQYMLPNAFSALDAVPMTPNGKIDRKALPAPGAAGSEAAGFVAPAGECEEKLAAIWRDILGLRQVGATDSFFDLGGHSLMVMPLIARIERELGRRLSVTAVFHGPTIRQIAALFDDGPAPRTVEIQAAGSRPPLYWIDPGPIFAGLARELGPDQPFTGLMFNTMATDARNQPSRIADIAPYLVDSIRAAQPHGPYYLGGWCADGLLAYDVASRLIAAGETVGLLVLLHAGNPLAIRRLGKAAVKLSLAKHKLRQLGRLSDLRSVALDRARKAAGRLAGRQAAAPQGHFFDGIIDATAMNYEPRPYAGDMALFQPVERPDIYDYRPGWAELVQGELTAFDVPGGHHTMLTEPHVRVLGDKLRACLERAQAKHPMPGRA
jgi:amino acid adenylation domain-containing protein